MQQQKSNTGSPARVEYGIELVEGLRSFPESEPLAAGFETLNEELDAAYELRRSKRKPMLKERARMRVKAHLADRVIRQTSKAAEIADGGKAGQIHGELFPRGLSPEVAPAGRKQLQPTKDLADRLEKSRNPKIAALRTEYLPKLRAAAESLDTAIKAYDRSLDEVVQAFRAEVAIRDDHALTVVKLMGEVRALFPRDRATQDAIFPTVTTRTSSTSSEEEDEDTTSGDATDPTEPS